MCGHLLFQFTGHLTRSFLLRVFRQYRTHNRPGFFFLAFLQQLDGLLHQVVMAAVMADTCNAIAGVPVVRVILEYALIRAVCIGILLCSTLHIALAQQLADI